MPLVYLSIGSNVGDSLRNVSQAVERIGLARGIKFLAQGGVYETEPQNVKEQKWFVNTAVAVDTDLPPRVLLEKTCAIENAMGRERNERWGPRVIDIDIVFYGDVKLETPSLTIPHPSTEKRRFVLQPIADIDPDVMHPILGKSVSSLLAKIIEEGQGMRMVAP